ncbi:MAG: class I SAM-dependent methyltransferase [Methylobacter sp.]
MNPTYSSMKILVAIANYGTKNAEYAKQLIREYRSMPFDVDIVVLCEASKGFGSDVTEIVGLPTKDPWSLPFGHRKLFVEHAEDYDLFIYTEDDTLIREDNIRAFLRASEKLPENLLPGFLRYELYPDGSKNYPEIHGPYHWVPKSVARFGEYACADLSNDHAACYMLTREQLQRAIRSGGFAMLPHSGRYDLLCTAATDPYTQCGFSKVICLSHLPEFELHHLPNVYLNRTGLSEKSHRVQVGALFDVLSKKSTDCELFVTEKPIATQCWDKNYYEPYRVDWLELIPASADRILSVGSGSGDTEAYLVEKGKKVMAIPLDSVIGRLAERRGVRILPPNFASAFEALGDERFDAIILADVLQHLREPASILSQLSRHLKPQGVVVGSVPNLNLIRRLLGRLVVRNKKWTSVTSVNGNFDGTALHRTSAHMLDKWLRASEFQVLDIKFDKPAVTSRFNDLAYRFPKAIAASNLVFAAGRRADYPAKSF